MIFGTTVRNKRHGAEDGSGQDWMGGYTRWPEAYLVTLADRCSFLCVSGQLVGPRRGQATNIFQVGSCRGFSRCRVERFHYPSDMNLLLRHGSVFIPILSCFILFCIKHPVDSHESSLSSSMSIALASTHFIVSTYLVYFAIMYFWDMKIIRAYPKECL